MNDSTVPNLPNLPPADADAAARRRRRLARIATLVAATLPPLAIWVVAVPVAGLDLTVGSGPSTQTVGPPSVAVAALVAGAGAWTVLAALERWAPRRARRTFTTAGWILLGLSCAGPVLTGGPGTTLASLVAMHVATGSVLILGLARTTEARRMLAGTDGSGRGALDGGPDADHTMRMTP